jgi:hypothetical protein
VLVFNTQAGTQWDGLRHFSYLKEKKFYNGVTMEEIHAPNSTIIGMQGNPSTILAHLAWAEKGIVGRGVLVDYYTWALEHAPYNPLEQYSIPFANFKECIRSQNLTFRRGDILIVRSGFTVSYSKLDIPAREAKAAINPAHFSGIEQSEEVLEWIWENQFSAVAGDAVGFECWRTPSPQN